MGLPHSGVMGHKDRNGAWLSWVSELATQVRDHPNFKERRGAKSSRERREKDKLARFVLRLANVRSPFSCRPPTDFALLGTADPHGVVRLRIHSVANWRGWRWLGTGELALPRYCAVRGSTMSMLSRVLGCRSSSSTTPKQASPVICE